MREEQNKAIYRAVNGVCAVNFEALHLPISKDESIRILEENDFTVYTPDIIERARYCADVAVFKRAAQPSVAPNIVDCSSFIKWVFGEMGIQIPRRTPQQIELGNAVSLEDAKKGDVIFTSGKVNYKLDGDEAHVGHVGLLSEKNTVLHASKVLNGIEEVSVEDFLQKRTLSGVRRFVEDFDTLTIFKTPEYREVESSDDIKWIVLQHVIR